MKRILTYGTFDLLHVGHLNILKRAKALGDHLTVAISTDEFNLSAKNKTCVMSYSDRAALVSHLRCVDRVVPEQAWDQKMTDVKEFDIDIFVMGHDWEGKFDFLKEHCEVVYLPRTENVSTTDIKAAIRSPNKQVAFSSNVMLKTG
jgi:glycerol-3-phosphate cytidylyltransferase